jgi:homoserine kinase
MWLLIHLCFLVVPSGVDDCLGIAVDLWSEVTVSRADKFEITAEGEGAEEMPKDNSNYMVVGCLAAFEAAGKPLPTLKYHVVSRIPYARGLGSSSAAIVAGIVAGLVLAGHRLPCWGSEALLQIAAGIEVGVIYESQLCVIPWYMITFAIHLISHFTSLGR